MTITGMLHHDVDFEAEYRFYSFSHLLIPVPPITSQMAFYRLHGTNVRIGHPVMLEPGAPLVGTTMRAEGLHNCDIID